MQILQRFKSVFRTNSHLLDAARPTTATAARRHGRICIGGKCQMLCANPQSRKCSAASRSLARSFASAAAAAADEIALIAPDHLHPPALALARLASSLASPSHLGLPPPPRFPFRILTLKIGPLGTGRAREEERESRTQHTRENRLTIVTVNQEEKARGGNAITCTSRGGKSRPFVCSV